MQPMLAAISQHGSSLTQAEAHAQPPVRALAEDGIGVAPELVQGDHRHTPMERGRVGLDPRPIIVQRKLQHQGGPPCGAKHVEDPVRGDLGDHHVLTDQAGHPQLRPVIYRGDRQNPQQGQLGLVERVAVGGRPGGPVGDQAMG
eukprot:8699296-Heterocapsa_arctica.AAC.1